MNRSILLPALLLLTDAAIAQAPKQAATSGPVITFRTQEHDYGTIANGANGECEFTYTNTGTEPLILISCRSSCGCVVPKCDPDPLAPGKSAVVRVRYDTKRTGPFTKSVTVESNALNTPIVVLRITGQVLQPPTETLPADNITQPVR